LGEAATVGVEAELAEAVGADVSPVPGVAPRQAASAMTRPMAMIPRMGRRSEAGWALFTDRISWSCANLPALAGSTSQTRWRPLRGTAPPRRCALAEGAALLGCRSAPAHGDPPRGPQRHDRAAAAAHLARRGIGDNHTTVRPTDPLPRARRLALAARPAPALGSTPPPARVASRTAGRREPRSRPS